MYKYIAIYNIYVINYKVKAKKKWIFINKEILLLAIKKKINEKFELETEFYLKRCHLQWIKIFIQKLDKFETSW